MTIEELKQALEAATPGPWHRGQPSIDTRVELETCLPYSSVTVCAPRRGAPICVCTELGIEDDTFLDANTRLIVEAVNNLPALLKVVEAAQELVVFTPADFPTHANLRKALEELNDD
jgi:hypothetical protein